MAAAMVRRSIAISSDIRLLLPPCETAQPSALRDASTPRPTTILESAVPRSETVALPGLATALAICAALLVLLRVASTVLAHLAVGDREQAAAADANFSFILHPLFFPAVKLISAGFFMGMSEWSFSTT